MSGSRLLVVIKSKTFWGAVLAGASTLLSQQPITLADWMTFAGVVIAAAGIRDAIAVHGAVNNPTLPGLR